MCENKSNKKANDNEYKTLDDAYIGTIKELSRLVREQAKQLEQINVTCYKCITIAAIVVVLCVVICYFYMQRSSKIESVPDSKPCICSISSSSVTEEK